MQAEAKENPFVPQLIGFTDTNHIQYGEYLQLSGHFPTTFTNY